VNSIGIKLRSDHWMDFWVRGSSPGGGPWSGNQPA